MMNAKSDYGVNPIGLEVGIKSDALVIVLPFAALQMAVECYSDFEQFDHETGKVHKPKITDVAAFAKEVLCALGDEGEDGSTLVTRMLDAAFTEVVENGAEGILLPGDDDYSHEPNSDGDGGDGAKPTPKSE